MTKQTTVVVIGALRVKILFSDSRFLMCFITDCGLYAADLNTVEETEKTNSLPYLCTGYHIYLTREPCIMYVQYMSLTFKHFIPYIFY